MSFRFHSNESHHVFVIFAYKNRWKLIDEIDDKVTGTNIWLFTFAFVCAQRYQLTRVGLSISNLHILEELNNTKLYHEIKHSIDK